MPNASHLTSAPASVATSHGSLNDHALARRASHDPGAFAELYRRHLTSVYRYHLARTGNVEDAQDLTAQTFLAALEAVASYRGPGTFAGWLFGIASHKLADYYRRRHEEFTLETTEDLHDPSLSPEDAASRRMQMERVARALRSVSADRAEALVLRLFAGLSAGEVARVMGKSESAVKMLVHRALGDLQHRLAVDLEVES